MSPDSVRSGCTVQGPRSEVYPPFLDRDLINPATILGIALPAGAR